MSSSNAAPHITIVFMGDSITEGQYVAPESRWSNLIVVRAHQAFEPNVGALCLFHNRGIPRETTRQALERYARDVQNTRPDVLTLQFGLNDCNCWDTDRGLPRVSEMAYRANLVEMISRARHFGTNQIILSTNHCTLRHKKLANSKTLEESRLRYNTIVREVAAETGVTLCDIEKGFSHFSQEELRGLLMPEPDVLHLSPKGHDHYAGLIYPYVMEAIHHCMHHSAQNKEAVKTILKKGGTDIHWNDRARMEEMDEKVNIGDIVQRELETQFILSALPTGARVLEVGCGNGYLTRILREQAGFVDAFDCAENMIERAKKYADERNNRFFCDNVLEPTFVEPPYDAIVCVRVLINLRNLQQQKQAIKNMAGLLKPGGKLILVEGYRDGFEALNGLRTGVTLPLLVPAGINFYSNFGEIQPVLEKYFTTGAKFHTGMFDFLTRVIYPLLVGANKVEEAGEFHRKILPLARLFNPDAFAKFGRLKGLELIKR